MSFNILKAAVLGGAFIAAASYSAHAAPVAGVTSAGSAQSMAQPTSDLRLRVGPGGVSVGVGDRRRPYHRGHRYNWGPGFYFYQGRYHGNCGWLRERARATGSRVWWQRYRNCRNG